MLLAQNESPRSQKVSCFDHSGSPPFKTDLRINQKRLVVRGSFPRKGLDGQGLVSRERIWLSGVCFHGKVLVVRGSFPGKGFGGQGFISKERFKKRWP